MFDEISIRKVNAQEEEYEIFRKIHEEFSYAVLPGEPEDDARKPIVKNFKEFSDLAEMEQLYFIEKEGEPIGYAVIYWYEDYTADIKEIYIVKTMQRKGYGYRAVQAIKSFAKKEEFKSLDVFSANMATDMFWTNCRFEYTGSSDTYRYNIM